MDQLSRYRFALLWAMFVLFVCGINGNSIPKISFDFGIDKIAHFFLFGTQAFLIIRADHKQTNQVRWMQVHKAVVLSILYGVLIEYLQAVLFVNRSYDYADMLANSIGALMNYPVVVFRKHKG